ncbi:MAG: glycosyltransferase family 39 protein [Anaerolineae bacterium]|nr:glycosyltransferase family 39 protein [Anaerolineae bacterium]
MPKPISNMLTAIKRWDAVLIGILLLAAVVRVSEPGLHQFRYDESHFLDKTVRLARHGEWMWLSNITSWDALPGHPPITNYMLAIPYLFTPDPRAPRVFVGLMGVIAVWLMVITTDRYFGRRAAVLAGLLFALSPTAVDWSRVALHPNMAQPFLALWILTGLLGYYEGKRWALPVFWLSYSVCVQAEIAFVMPLTLISLVVLGAGWYRPETNRRTLIRYTLLGWALGILTAVPWMIGLIKGGILDQGDSDLAVEHVTHSFRYVQIVFSYVTSSTDFYSIQRAESAGSGNWWPSFDMDTVLWVKTWLTLAGAGWLLVEGWRKRWAGMPGILLALITLIPLSVFLVTPFFVYEFYMLPILFGAYPIQGILLARLAQARSWARWPVTAALCVFLVMQSWLLLGLWRWLHLDGAQEFLRTPMSLYLDVLDEWADQSEHITIITETDEGKYSPLHQDRLWRVVSEGYPARIVTMPQGIPIHPDGEILVGTSAGTTIPDLFGPGEPAGELADGHTMFNWVQIPPGYQPTPDVTPDGPARFANGAHIIGYQADALPQPGEPWPLLLLWQPERSDIDQQYQFSIRLVDTQGTTYSQMDITSLQGWLWHAGDLVLNPVTLPASDDLPADGLQVQLVMYSWPEIKNAGVIDDSGIPVASWMYLPIPSQAASPPE